AKELQLYDVAAIVATDSMFKNPVVLSIASGRYCISIKGLTKCKPGTAILDARAEVLVRRGFKLLLFDELQSKSSTLLEYSDETKKFHLKPDLRLHFYAPHVQNMEYTKLSKYHRFKMNNLENLTFNNLSDKMA